MLKFKTLLHFVPVITAALLLGLTVQARQLDCRSKGCLATGEQDTLIIYFRGHNKDYGGPPGRLPKQYWPASARDVLTKERYNLLKHNFRGSVYATGSSHLSLTAGEIQALLKDAGAQKIILASHSGGYVGLRNTISNLPPSLKDKVVSLQMLDNFYGTATTRKILRRNFTDQFLRQNCYGFTTPHNRQRYLGAFQDICPKVDEFKSRDTKGRSNHVEALRCMAHFESGVQCHQPIPARVPQAEVAEPPKADTSNMEINVTF